MNADLMTPGTSALDAAQWSLDAVAARHREAAHAEELAAQLRLADRFGPDLAATYVKLDAVARAARQQATRPNTDKARRAARVVWERFCATVGVPTGVVEGDLLDVYALWLLHSGNADGGPFALASARAHLKNTLTVLRAAGVELPEHAGRNAAEMLTLAHEELARDNRHAEGRGQAEAVTWPDLQRAVDACDTTTLVGLRARAVLLTGWLLMARASELADLQVGDVKWLRRGQFVAVTVRASKTSGSARTNEADCQDDAYCVLTALREYLDALAAALGLASRDELPKSAPLFRRIDRWGKPGAAAMSPDSITDLIAAAAEQAELDYRVTGHSLRSGGATDALAQGLPITTVARLGGWTPNSTELAGYLRDSRHLDQRASVQRMRRTA